MARVLRPNYAQRFLLPPALDEWVPKTHPARFVRDFVDSLDLAALGMEQVVAPEGRPPYAVDLLLKVWLFGYMERIRSPRALEKACLQVMPFLWLAGNLHPDHNTLWRFFKLHSKGLPKLFKKLVKTAADAELVGFVLHALDGTKLTAASSTDEAHHRKSLEEKLKRLDEFIAAYVQEVNRRAEEDEGQGYAMPDAMGDAAARLAKIRALLERRIEDREDEKLLAEEGAAPTSSATTGEPKSATTGEPKPTTTAEPKPPGDDDLPPGGDGGAGAQSTEGNAEPPADPLLREAEALKEELAAKLTTLDEAGVGHLHEAEPEARMMKGRGTHALGYNAQVVVDHDSDLIVACDVVNEQNDLTQLRPMLERVNETLGRVADNSVGDTGYANGDQLKDTEALGMSVIVSLRDEPDAKGEYSKAYFRYDAESDVYVCPQGERLVQIGTNKSHATTQHPDAIYRCHNKTCPVRAACTKNPRGRQIRRPYGEEARARQAQKQQDPRMRLLLSLRKEIVEHIFGIVKGIDGFRRFTVRGLEKARAQWALVCTAVNLRKLYAWWRKGKLTFGPPQTPPPGPAAAATP
jgi:transposase